MQISAHTVTRVVLDDAESVGLDVVFNGTSDVQKGVPSLDLTQSSHQRFLGHTAKGLSLSR